MKNFKKKDIIALAVVGALIIATIVVGIIIITGNVNEANSKVPTTEETQVVTELATDEQGNTVAVTATQADESEATSAVSEENSEPDATQATKNNSDKVTATEKTTKPNSNSSSNNKTPTDSKGDQDFEINNKPNDGEVEVITPETKPVNKDEKILTINGTKCNVGNTVTITLNVKTPVVLENYQGFTEYDDSVLEFVSIKGNVSGMFNNHESAIYYNGSDIGAGYDFTKEGTLYTATFKVLKSGSTKINNVIEVMSDKNSEAVDQSKCQYTIGVFN